ncbi:hypothetical protein IQ247_01060 [Plectonema cf. radiosum LEGE 06105]|uniref:Uncharacterized protein n=1 Tax=Plectonema cf. radiosum LEGE 06105 TaxID=945769 RepID=A0A8J7EYF3_9CYAN|nr:hypothetical protein [Plectonema radiosum]MBE9211322.1 hypothetical protein [Plectonema cf. radiosum LEGE 06105]
MKQMLTVSGGVLFAIAIISAIFGGGFFIQKLQFEQELANRGDFNKTVSKIIGLDEFNKQKLEGIQTGVNTSFAVAGISGVLGIGLAIAGKTKTAQ